jgi:hypothetical protein
MRWKDHDAFERAFARFLYEQSLQVYVRYPPCGDSRQQRTIDQDSW